MNDSTPRTKRLIEALGLTQAEMAEMLGVRQATVSRLVAGQRESGPVSILLDAIERKPRSSRIQHEARQ